MAAILPILAVLLSLLSFGARAADEVPTLRAREFSESTVTSEQGREYRILGCAPSGPPPPCGFPVIFVLDGDAWFGTAIEIARMREYEKLAPAVSALNRGIPFALRPQ
jgi:predicted alpha/beta superfamily hydrolase